MTHSELGRVCSLGILSYGSTLWWQYSEIFCILKPSYFALFVKVYKVLIKLPDGRSYFIFRRYNEFHQLCDKVQMYCKEDSICLQTLIRGSDVISSCVLYSQLSP